MPETVTMTFNVVDVLIIAFALTMMVILACWVITKTT